MKKIYFKNLNEYFEQEITIEGFVDNIRDLQYVQFLIVRDTTGKVQVTIEKNEINSRLNEIVSNLAVESTVKITGTLLKNEKVKLNGMEIIPKEILVTSHKDFYTNASSYIGVNLGPTNQFGMQEYNKNIYYSYIFSISLCHPIDW